MLHGPNSKVNLVSWCLILLSCLLLSGCSTLMQNQDNSNPGKKYAEKTSYRIHGKNYHVMASAKNYEEKGVASWYGRKFHKQRTSSGERYNMLAMTAAHRTLPLSTYVEVTNLNNGRKVIVKVNDRGPFASNRLIDLSYLAAKKLGMIGHGTVLVDIKAVDPNDAQRGILAQSKVKNKYLS